MSHHNGDLTAAIMAAAKSPAGMRTDSIEGYSTMQVGRMAQKLCARGELFVAKISHRSAKYFATEAAAQALTSKRGITIRKRLVPHSSWDEVAPAVIPDGLKPLELPMPPERFAPDPADQSWKLFSACKIGEHPMPVSRWAEAAAT